MTAELTVDHLSTNTTKDHILTKKEERQVVVASSLGSLFEWYDFFIYGSLAIYISQILFPHDNPSVAFLAALGALSVGFVIRPLGAILFGYLGDRFGRKYTFLATVVLMGGATVLIGLIPSFDSIGHLSWILLLFFRILQGLAVGGEYGGAITYISEHSRPERRGLLTGWLQSTSSAGLIMSLLVIVITQFFMDAESFRQWGWRIPFLISIFLLLLSIYIRAKLKESPVFMKMKAENRVLKNPLKESFGKWKNFKLILIAIFGLTAGMGSTYFTGQFYVMVFLQQAAQLELNIVYEVILMGFIIGLPTFILFSWLTNYINRKWFLMAGLFLAALSYNFLFASLLQAANPGLVNANKTNPITLYADATNNTCNFSFTASMLGSHPDHAKTCVQAKKFFVSKGISFEYAAPLPGQVVSMNVGDITVEGFNAQAYTQALTESGYPLVADKNEINKAKMIFILAIMTALVAMVYGPAAAYLAELFPAHIRYTAISFPYHIGAGIFGGLLPFMATYLSQASGNIYGGLIYPVVITTAVGIIGSLFLPNFKKEADK